MDAIRFELRPFTERAHLTASYVGVSLSFDAPPGSPRRDGVDLRPFGAAHDVTYVPGSRVVLEIDFLVPQEGWVVVEPFPAWPVPARRAALALSEEPAEADGDDVSDIPVVTKTDATHSQVLVDLAYVPGAGKAYELSDNALAVLDGDRLVALFARLN